MANTAPSSLRAAPIFPCSILNGSTPLPKVRGCNIPLGKGVPDSYTHTYIGSAKAAPVLGSAFSRTRSGLCHPSKNGSSRLNPVSRPMVSSLSSPMWLVSTAAISIVGSIRVIAIELPRANPNILAPILYSLNGILLLLHRKICSYKGLSLIGQFVRHTTFWNNRSHGDGLPHVIEPEQVTGKDHRA